MKTLIFKGDTGKAVQLEALRYQLAMYICEENKSRSSFIPDIEFSNASWDILLDIFTAEYLDRSTSIAAVSTRIEIPESLCLRYVNYLLGKGVIFENSNQHTMDAMPLLLPKLTKERLGAWLDDCLTKRPDIEVLLSARE